METLVVPRHAMKVYTFGAPRVGNQAFSNAFHAAVPHCFRICNYWDGITRCPTPSMGFDHCGCAVLVHSETGDLYIDGASRDPISQWFTSFEAFVQYESQNILSWITGDAIKHHKEETYATSLHRVMEALDRKSPSAR